MSSTKRSRPGVLFGDEVKELLDYAKAHEFALPAINCIGTNPVNATLAAARELNSPTMIQFSNSGAPILHRQRDLQGKPGCRPDPGSHRRGALRGRSGQGLRRSGNP